MSVNSTHASKNASAPSWNIAANSSRLVLRAQPAYSRHCASWSRATSRFTSITCTCPAVVERHNIGPELPAEGGLACDWEERHPDECFEVGLQQLLDLLLVEPLSGLYPPEGDQFVVSNLE